MKRSAHVVCTTCDANAPLGIGALKSSMFGLKKKGLAYANSVDKQLRLWVVKLSIKNTKMWN